MYEPSTKKSFTQLPSSGEGRGRRKGPHMGEAFYAHGQMLSPEFITHTSSAGSVGLVKSRKCG